MPKPLTWLQKHKIEVDGGGADHEHPKFPRAADHIVTRRGLDSGQVESVLGKFPPSCERCVRAWVEDSL